MINKFHKTNILELPKTFEYLVIERKNGSNLDYFNVKVFQ